MLILQALLLWLIVSALMIGGAMLFHRLFPDESPWFGYIVPSLAIVLTLNFIEHLIAIPSLLLLLPVLLGVSVWMWVSGKFWQQALMLPTIVFLATFAFTFLVRCLHADIEFTSDGISDLNMVNNFSQGQTIPPPDCWMPPSRFEWYYDLQHYAASVMERLLNVKVGVAYNVSHALLSALTCVVGAAAAFRISGGKVWITLAVPFLLESAATGSTAFLLLFCHNVDLWLPFDLSGGMTLPHPDNNPTWQSPIWKYLIWDPRPAVAHVNPPSTLRLQVPGIWTWRDEYHANASGHFLTLFAVWLIAELGHARRSNWPWLLAAITPLLAVIASAWALPITALLCWGGLGIAWFYKFRPTSNRAVGVTLFVVLTLLWPALYNATSSPAVPPTNWIDPQDRTPIFEFLLQWWPILLLWICGVACFRKLPFGLRWVLFVVPVMLIFIEMVTIDSRYNTIEKMWGYTWGAALVALFPYIASRTAVVFRLVTVVMLFSAMTGFYSFVHDLFLGTWDGAAFHLEGTAYITHDAQKKRMLEIVGQTKDAIYLSGKTAFCYNEAPALAVFTKNKSYIAWYWFESLTNYQNEAEYRRKQNDDFYSGAMADRLSFLKNHQIDGVIIWPDDAIDDNTLAALQKDIEPDYNYIDCKGTGANNAGVFMLQGK
jgi:hypothetical protein